MDRSGGRLLVLAAICCGALSQAAATSRAEVPDEHSRTVEVPGGRIWFRVVGSGPGPPLILLHGGPGASSHYLESLAELGDERPVVFYDQLGCGRSERPSDPALWKIERFVEELEVLRAHLGFEKVHLVGHSWGTVLALEYIRSHPEAAISVTFASPGLDVPRWVADAARLRAQLPPAVRATLDDHEAAGTTNSPEYAEATNEFYRRHFCRSDPWPPALETSLSPDQFGQLVYEAMWGPNEFTVTGSLRSYVATEHLKKLTLPVLYTTGRFDLATPGSVDSLHRVTPNSRMVVFEKSGHMTMLDEPELYRAVLRQFLREADRDVPSADPSP
jgi:proline iminopeptidase